MRTASPRSAMPISSARSPPKAIPLPSSPATPLSAMCADGGGDLIAESRELDRLVCGQTGGRALPYSSHAAVTEARSETRIAISH